MAVPCLQAAGFRENPDPVTAFLFIENFRGQNHWRAGGLIEIGNRPNKPRNRIVVVLGRMSAGTTDFSVSGIIDRYGATLFLLRVLALMRLNHSVSDGTHGEDADAASQRAL